MRPPPRRGYTKNNCVAYAYRAGLACRLLMFRVRKRTKLNYSPCARKWGSGGEFRVSDRCDCLRVKSLGLLLNFL